MRLACLAGAVALANVVSAAPGGTLGRGVRPTAQAVHLEVDPASPAFRGTTRLDLQVETPTASFALHAAGPRVRAARLAGAGLSFDATVSAGPAETIVVRAPEPLAPGAWTLDLAFDAPFDEQATGLYRVEIDGAWSAYTQFQADDARQAFPCFDEPAHKIPWQLTVDVPTGLEVVSNTLPVEDAVRGRRRHVVFARTPPMPSYLVALAVGAFDVVPVPGPGVPTRVITRRGQGAMAAEAVRVTPPLLAELERWFGRPYPYTKLDLVAVPEFWPGAMENAGAVTFAEDVLLADPKVAMSPLQRRELAITVSHELAHMWFGNLVTMRWWDDLWLSESFASWMGNKAVHAVFPELNLPVHAVVAAELAMETDARQGTRAIRQPVDAVDNLLQLADELAYEKGEAVLGMVEAWLGADVFRRGVLLYLERHAWGNADAADLWRALGDAAAREVSGPLASFVDQAGVPLVSAEPLGDGRVRLRQRRFAHAGATVPATLWQVPVGIRYARGGSARRVDVLLATAEQDVELPGEGDLEWIHPHADARGYYRWSLPPSWLHAAAASAEHLGVAERVGFVGNLAALLQGGIVSGDDYLHAVSAFVGDRDPAVVTATLDALALAEEALVAPESEADFALWLRQRLGPALERIGPAPRPGEPEGTAELRGRLVQWLGTHGDDAVRAHAAGLAHDHLERPGSVEPAIVSAALRVTARHGDRATYDRLRKGFESAASAVERQRHLSALGNFGDPTLADEALRYALAGPLRPQELATIPLAVAGVRGNEDRALAWLVANYEPLARRVPAPMLVYLPWLADGCSRERLARARDFFAQRPIAGIDRELSALGESVEGCAALREREGARAAAFLSAAARPPAGEDARVLLETEYGDVDVQVLGSQAPRSAANFLRYVDEGRYDGGVFHRTVRDGNQPGQAVTIDVVQASVAPRFQDQDHPPVALERTRDTGLRHEDGTISMARAKPDTATSDFFICIGPQPELDFGGRRNPDGQGFAAFGRVVRGMDVVRRIQQAAADGQKLTPPVVIRKARRIR